MRWGFANALVITRDYVTYKKPAWAPALVHVIRLCERIVLLLPVITRIKADVFNYRLLPAERLRRWRCQKSDTNKIQKKKGGNDINDIKTLD